MIREVLRSDIVHKSDIYSLLSQSDNKSSSSVRLFWRPTNKLRKELWDSYEKNNSWKIYGAFVDGVIVGIATLLIEPSLDSMNTGDITNVSVNPHHRGTGI